MVWFVCRGSPGVWHNARLAASYLVRSCIRSSPANTGPQSFSELISQEHVTNHARKRDHAEADRARLHLFRPARYRQDHRRAHHRALPELHQGPDRRRRAACARAASRSRPANSVDVIEIDAASNRGINEMRELRENVRYRPARDRYKVFIIDEAHQITNEAFNALLKTLEEPPEWVVFILCTTESHKIPATIASRCQQFSFRSVDFEELVGAHASGSASRKGFRPTTRRSAFWRRRAKAASAIRSPRSTRRSPAAATR